MPRRAIALTTALFTASAFAPPKHKPKPQPQRHAAPELDETVADLVLPPRTPPPVPPPSPPILAAPVVATSARAATASSRPAKRAAGSDRGGRRVARAAGAQGALARIRQCESGSDYGARSASGRYGGAYQMDRRTFASVGGSGDPAAASKAEQDYRARVLYQQRGSQPWANCAQRA